MSAVGLFPKPYLSASLAKLVSGIQFCFLTLSSLATASSSYSALISLSLSSLLLSFWFISSITTELSSTTSSTWGSMSILISKALSSRFACLLLTFDIWYFPLSPNLQRSIWSFINALSSLGTLSRGRQGQSRWRSLILQFSVVQKDSTQDRNLCWHFEILKMRSRCSKNLAFW